MTPERPVRAADVRAALALAPFDVAAAQRRMSPDFRDRLPTQDNARPAAALLYVFERRGILYFPLTLRREDLPEHRGQVALPGGRPDGRESSWATAVREAHEEVGLDPELPVGLGRLAPVYIPPTHTTLDVHVALGPDPVTFVAEAREVAAISLATVDALVDPSTRRVQRAVHGGREMEVPSFELAGFDVWGATAIALSEFRERLRQVLST